MRRRAAFQLQLMPYKRGKATVDCAQPAAAVALGQPCCRAQSSLHGVNLTHSEHAALR